MKKTAKAPISAEFLPILFLMGLAFALFFYHLGSYPLFDMDEPRYAEAAREMLERGNWITPTFNYELRFDKPVFFYWLIAGAYQLFGVTEFAARFFSAFSAIMVLFSLYALGRYWVSSRLGLYAAIIFATSLEVIGLGRMSITDMTLANLMTATSLSLFMATHHSKKWWLLGGIFGALAILTKGPVGIVLPGSIVLLYTLLMGRFRETFLNRWFLFALLLCATLALPWYYLAYLENGQVFLDALFLHNVNRFTGVVSGHEEPVFFFLLVLLLGFLPWSPFLPSALQYWWPKAKPAYAEERQQNPVYWMALYGAIWVLFTFLFFTAAQTKLLTYILPLFPGAALLLGATWYQAAHPENSTLQRSFVLSSWILFTLLLGLGLVFVSRPALFLPREAHYFSENPITLLPILFIIVGTLGMSVFLSKRRLSAALFTQGLAMAAVALVSAQGILPEVNKATQGAVFRYLKEAGPNTLITYEMARPSLTYYGRKKIMHLAHDDRGKLVSLLHTHAILYVIAKNNFLGELQQIHPPESQMTIIEKGPHYTLVLLKASPLK